MRCSDIISNAFPLIQLSIGISASIILHVLLLYIYHDEQGTPLSVKLFGMSLRSDIKENEDGIYTTLVCVHNYGNKRVYSAFAKAMSAWAQKR